MLLVFLLLALSGLFVLFLLLEIVDIVYADVGSASVVKTLQDESWRNPILQLRADHRREFIQCMAPVARVGRERSAGVIVSPFVDGKHVVNCKSVGIHTSVDGDAERTVGRGGVRAALLGPIFGLLLGPVWATSIAPEVDGDLLFLAAVKRS